MTAGFFMSWAMRSPRGVRMPWRMALPNQAAICARSAMAWMASRVGFRGARPLASMAASSMKAA